MCALLQVLRLLIITAIIGDAMAFNCLYEMKFRNRNFVEQISLLGPTNLIENWRTVANLLKDKVGTNYTCGRDLAIFEDALARKETWALKMWDASSKIPSGILEGNVIDLGMFDECVNIKDESQGVQIRGQHCMYSITSVDEKARPYLTPTLSICMPSTCNTTDIIYLFNSTVRTIDSLKDPEITITSVRCTTTDKEFWTTEFIIFSLIIIAYVGLLLFCTFVDVIFQGRDAGKCDRHPMISTLTKFSFVKSISSIFNTRVQEDHLPSLHGIRFLSMFCIVLGHKYLAYFLAVNVNGLTMTNWLQSWKFSLTLSAPFIVDTFITMSGFLMTYLFLKKTPKEKNFNVLKYYLHRYLRLTPAVFVVLMSSIVLGSKVGTGPRTDEMVGVLLDSCRKNWWATIFYVQNFVDKESLCVGHLWYLAVDMQLFWISPIILYPLHKKPKLGWTILFVMFLASMAIPGAIVGLNQYSANVFTPNGNVQMTSDEFKYFYKMPYNRAGPWLLGIMLGFEVANNNRKLGKFAVFVGWLVSIGAFLFCIFGTQLSIKPDYEYNVLWEAIFAAVNRHVWAVGICWIIYACLHDCAGPLSTVLSWNVFLPLSRISYSVYLIHIPLIMAPVMTQKIPYYFSELLILREFVPDFIISIGIGFVFTLLFESPIITLEKIIFTRKYKNVNGSKKNLTSEDYKDKQN